MNSRIPFAAHTWPLFLLCAAGMLGCDESLPPRATPSTPVGVTVGIASGHYRINRIVLPQRDSLYAMLPLHIDVLFQNNYTEVLQDSVDVQGTIEVWDRDRPDRRATVSLRGASIFPSPSYPGRQITLRPGDEADVVAYWNHRAYSTVTGDSVLMSDGLHTTPTQVFNPKTGTYFTVQVTDPVHLEAQATLRVFVTTGFVISAIATQDVQYDIWPP